MGVLKKLGDFDFRKLSFLKGNCFDFSTGNLDSNQYLILNEEVNKLKDQGFNTNYFEDFLENYRLVCKFRRD